MASSRTFPHCWTSWPQTSIPIATAKADIRASLKPLGESVHRWQQILSDLPSRPSFQVSRDDAVDALKDLADQTSQLIVDQSNYFEEHKDERGQDRAEPKWKGRERGNKGTRELREVSVLGLQLSVFCSSDNCLLTTDN